MSDPLTRLAMAARLARWLGPWAPADTRPSRVLRRTERIGGESVFDAWVYRTERPPVGALLLVPGLHYLGPADVRLDRFLSVLANAGLLVLCPFLPEFRRLRVGTSLIANTQAAFDALLELPDAPPNKRAGVFSISFGSFPALYLMASPAHRDRVGALTIFGGYASFEDVIRFSLEGDPGRPHDPLNRPVVFLNLLEHFDGLPEDREPLRRAWIRYVRRTWGKPENKERARWEPVARQVAARTPAPYRELFLMGTGAIEGGDERVAQALVLGRESLRHLDPGPICPGITRPVTLIHGRDDDVIPYTQAQKLLGQLPEPCGAKLWLTGIYGHTAHGTIDPGAVRDEVRSLMGILEAIVSSVG